MASVEVQVEPNRSEEFVDPSLEMNEHGVEVTDGAGQRVLYPWHVVKKVILGG